MQTDVNSLEQFNDFISSNKGAVVYFSTPDCNVCKILKPKLIELIETEFPKMSFLFVDVEVAKEIAASNNVFTVPTILFFFECKEYIRKSRFVNLDELGLELRRLYNLFYE